MSSLMLLLGMLIIPPHLSRNHQCGLGRPCFHTPMAVRYFTSHGPRVQTLDQRLDGFFPQSREHYLSSMLPDMQEIMHLS